MKNEKIYYRTLNEFIYILILINDNVYEKFIPNLIIKKIL
jgi:hypothetical protein